MRYGSLFSGAGGLDLAIEEVFGAKCVWQCEVDPAASKVLAHRFPEVPNLGDVSEINWNALRFHIEDIPGVSFKPDILCGGFPCQDISSAGRQAGMGEGTRSGLWSEFARAIKQLRPKLVVIENVRNLLSVEANRTVEHQEATLGDGADGPVLRAIGAVLGDLCDLGYDAQWTTVAARDIGAPHRRDRVFILATDTTCDGWARFDDSAGSTSTRGGRVRLAGGSAWRGAESVKLLPTPRRSDGDGGPNPLSRAERMDDVETRVIRCAGQWGEYEAGLSCWESLTRPMPSPTEESVLGNVRLNPAFNEWMMGWPDGWVTGVPGISRNGQLHIIGNGVCPQQAEYALRQLIQASEVAA